MVRPSTYIQAKIRSRLFNIVAILLVAFDVLFFADLYIDHWDEDGFFEVITDPFSIALFSLPIVVAGFFMFLSKCADRAMVEMLKEHRRELSERMRKKSQ